VRDVADAGGFWHFGGSSITHASAHYTHQLRGTGRLTDECGFTTVRTISPACERGYFARQPTRAGHRVRQPRSRTETDALCDRPHSAAIASTFSEQGKVDLKQVSIKAVHDPVRFRTPHLDLSTCSWDSRSRGPVRKNELAAPGA